MIRTGINGVITAWLGERFTDLEPLTGPPWRVRIAAHSADTTIAVNDDWLRLETRCGDLKGAAPFDRLLVQSRHRGAKYVVRSPAAPCDSEVAARAEAHLERGRVKGVIDKLQLALCGTQALLVVPAFDGLSSEASEASHSEVSHRPHPEAKAEPASLHAVLTDSQLDVAEVSGTGGWLLNACGYRIEVARAGNGWRASLAATVAGTLPLAEPMRTALAPFLLRVAASIYGARPYVRQVGDAYAIGFESDLTHTPSTADLTHAAGALVAATRRYAKPIEALAQEPLLANGYLARLRGR